MPRRERDREIARRRKRKKESKKLKAKSLLARATESGRKRQEKGPLESPKEATEPSASESSS